MKDLRQTSYSKKRFVWFMFLKVHDLGADSNEAIWNLFYITNDMNMPHIT